MTIALPRPDRVSTPGPPADRLYDLVLLCNGSIPISCQRRLLHEAAEPSA